jgi:hypothetical protein
MQVLHVHFYLLGSFTLRKTRTHHKLHVFPLDIPSLHHLSTTTLREDQVSLFHNNELSATARDTASRSACHLPMAFFQCLVLIVAGGHLCAAAPQSRVTNYRNTTIKIPALNSSTSGVPLNAFMSYSIEFSSFPVGSARRALEQRAAVLIYFINSGLRWQPLFS